MNVLIDSSVWVEFFADGPRAKDFSKIIEKADKKNFFTPTIVLFEVFKKILIGLNEKTASKSIAFILDNTSIIDLTSKTSIFAAQLSAERKIPMADSIILATAIEHNAKIFTADKHFRGMPEAQML